jgi:hypothetical protein
MNLTMLKFLYSEFSPQRLEQAKQDCRKEVGFIEYSLNKYVVNSQLLYL